MKILSFGSLKLDKVYSVDHFVRAGETLSSAKLEAFCGGKGPNQAVDTTAAGDTFTVFFVAAIADGIDVKTALEQATKAAAISVSRKGAAPSIPTREEMLAF